MRQHDDWYARQVELIGQDPISGIEIGEVSHPVVGWIAGGGQDSLLTLTWYLHGRFTHAFASQKQLMVEAVYYDYGQNKATADLELAAVQRQIKFFEGKFNRKDGKNLQFNLRKAKLPMAAAMKNVSLSDKKADPNKTHVVHYRNIKFMLDQAEYMSLNYPKTRMALLYGANPGTTLPLQGEPTWLPDNFYRACVDAARVIRSHDAATYSLSRERVDMGIDLMAPTVFLQKAGITHQLFAFSHFFARWSNDGLVNLNELTSSCYNPQGGQQCCDCKSCRPRMVGDAQTGWFMDPLMYRMDGPDA